MAREETPLGTVRETLICSSHTGKRGGEVRESTLAAPGWTFWDGMMGVVPDRLNDEGKSENREEGRAWRCHCPVFVRESAITEMKVGEDDKAHK